MASYTITTTREREIGLKFSYDTYADKTVYTTQQSWLQHKVNVQVTDPMFADQQRANAVAYDASFATIPDAEQPAAQAEIEAVIVGHGGEIVPPGAPPAPPGAG